MHLTSIPEEPRRERGHVEIYFASSPYEFKLLSELARCMQSNKDIRPKLLQSDLKAYLKLLLVPALAKGHKGMCEYYVKHKRDTTTTVIDLTHVDHGEKLAPKH